jgi:chromate transport protein ChrA
VSIALKIEWQHSVDMTNASKPTFLELAALFLRLSLFALGGPMAHIALAEELSMQNEYTTKQ